MPDRETPQEWFQRKLEEFKYDPEWQKEFRDLMTEEVYSDATLEDYQSYEQYEEG